MLIALAALKDLPCALVPGGVTLPAQNGEDAGKIQSVGARFSHGLITLKRPPNWAAGPARHPVAAASFSGTAATAQAVAEALGLTLPHAALAPSGQRSGATGRTHRTRFDGHGRARRDDQGHRDGRRDYQRDDGSRGLRRLDELLLHVPAIAHAAGLRRPTVDEWSRVNQAVPRLVDVLPNGPTDHPTVRFFLPAACRKSCSI
jgi:dihydroxyacid dehydratase/phosphogluconate dehydratase